MCLPCYFACSKRLLTKFIVCDGERLSNEFQSINLIHLIVKVMDMPFPHYFVFIIMTIFHNKRHIFNLLKNLTSFLNFLKQKKEKVNVSNAIMAEAFACHERGSVGANKRTMCKYFVTERCFYKH